MKFIKMCFLALTLIFLMSLAGTNTYAVNDRTISGDTTRFSEGNAYANNIQNAGYDARSTTLYLNFSLTTTESVVGLTPTWTYYAEVFDGSAGTEGASLLGTYAYNYDAPDSKAGALGINTAQVTNHTIDVTSFPAKHRIIINVKDITTN